MKTRRASFSERGFTLIELMVAMAITTIIVLVLVSITSLAIDTWNRSRSELRASRQAKALVEIMARDFEGIVTRSGNTNEWLSAVSPSPDTTVPLPSSNAMSLIFFSGATDRYNGDIGVAGKDNGGDVSCVAYGLKYKDPITLNGAVKTFVLNRMLVNPDKTFTDLLGKSDLVNAFTSYATQLDDSSNFVCENIYQFTVTFRVEATHVTGTTSTIVPVAVTVGQNGTTQVCPSFKINGSTGIVASITSTAVTAAELAAGRIRAVEISVTVLTDTGVDQMRKRTFTSDALRSDFLAKNSYQYTKLVQLTSM